VLSPVGLTIGNLIQSQWFPDNTWVLFDLGSVHFDLAHLIAAATVIASTVLNVWESGSRCASIKSSVSPS
jgi:hypothetical protein